MTAARIYTYQLLPIVILSAILLGYLLYLDIFTIKEDLSEDAHSRLLLKEEFIKDYFADAVGDILFLEQTGIPYRIVKGDGDNQAVQDLAAFSKTARRYDQLRVLDFSGKEMVKVNYIDNQPVLVSKDSLQSKSNRYYFKGLGQLSAGQIYLSAFDLNVEYGSIETPENPVIRIGTLVKEDSHPIGYLIANVQLRDFFERIERYYPGTDEQFFLLNENGYYLEAPPGFQTFGWLKEVGNSSRFTIDFEEAWTSFSKNDSVKIETKRGLFSIKKIDMKSLLSTIPYLDGPETSIRDTDDLILVSRIDQQMLFAQTLPAYKLYISVWLVLSIFSSILAYIRTRAFANQRQTNDRLSELNDALQIRNQQLYDFNYIISHNLRGPASNVSIFTEMIPDDGKNVDPEVISHLKLSAGNLSTMTENLVQTLQIINNKKIEHEKCSVSATLESTMQMLQSLIHESSAEIVLDNESWDTVLFPKLYFESIFQNLLSNALKYASPKRKPKISVKTDRIEQRKVLSVADNGLGIDLQNNKDKIFKFSKRFHRHIPGSGAGLFITKAQIESQGGSIILESSIDLGTTIKICFPDYEKP